MFPFNLFKKKKSELEEDESYDLNQGNSQDLNTLTTSSMQNYPNLDKQDLIISKLETINAKLDNMNERLKKIEEYAK